MKTILDDYSKLTFSIHPQALPAYTFFHEMHLALPGCHDAQLINESALLSGQVLQATRERNNILVIAGFEHVFFDLEKVHPVESTVIIHQKVSEAEIASIAWQAVMRALLSSREER